MINRAGQRSHAGQPLVGLFGGVCGGVASVQGAILFGTDQRRPVKKIVKLSELQKQKAAKMLREGKVWGEPTG